MRIAVVDIDERMNVQGIDMKRLVGSSEACMDACAMHGSMSWCSAMEDGDCVVTYRSNSYARSRARVPWPKPVT